MNFSQQLDLAHAKYAFYDLHLDNKKIAENIQKELKIISAKSLLISGHLGVAAELINKGFNVTILSPSEDMKNYARKFLPVANVLVGDMKNLKFNGRFDAIVSLGDAFSHLTDDRDVHQAFSSFYDGLKYGGIVMVESLAADKMVQSVGNSVAKVENGELKIKRASSLTINEKIPSLATWKVAYELMQNGRRNVYEEHSKIRGFRQKEIERILSGLNFQSIRFLESGKGNNFITLARK